MYTFAPAGVFSTRFFFFFFLEILAAPHAVAVDPKMDLVLD